VIDQIGAAFGEHLLDVHSDPDHHRSAFTLAGEPDELPGTVAEGAARAIELLAIEGHAGMHPRVGVVDVAPIVYLRERDRGAACAEALVLADLLGEALGLPVFLYGILAGGRTRAQLRRGGHENLGRRIQAGELKPDFGPPRLHPTAGATLVAARPPLVAFNVELEPGATLDDAKQIAARIREGGAEGLTGVRALGLWLATRGVAQVSTNVENYSATPVAAVVAAVSRHAGVAETELVGLAPAAALHGFPADVRLRGRATIEDALAQRSRTA
jgi:glutamate formiminotransferase